jgi:hypothetical protein
MNKDQRDILDVLKSELAFLEKGGYANWPRPAQGFQHIFEDSPACMNYNFSNFAPCSECVLIQLVPPEFHGNRIPCRHIPLNDKGQTLDSIYRYGGSNIEGICGKWLRTTIASLEKERHAPLDSGKKPSAPNSNKSKG